jgi:hypothetical protein
VGSVVILMAYFVFVTWGYLVGFGVDNVGKINFDIPFPVTTVAQRVWGGGWVLLLFALLNSAIAVSIACFTPAPAPGTGWAAPASCRRRSARWCRAGRPRTTPSTCRSP